MHQPLRLGTTMTSRFGKTARHLMIVVAPALIVLAVAAASLIACGTVGSTDRPPESQNGASTWSDAGVPRPIPPASTRRGVIVPSDTGLGATPSGSASVTGTSGGAVGPTFGSPNGNNN
jgi:hypothetical protein